MVVLCVIALAQVVFVPGLLALGLTRTRTGSVIETAVVAFALSLSINYAVVYLLASLGIYSRTSVLMLLVVEAVLAGVLWWRERESLRGGGLRILQPGVKPDRWSTATAVVWSATAVGFALMIAARAALSLRVFSAWDAVFSWNRWAYTWYTGAVPTDTFSYPQLVPANWSLLYRITGSAELQFLALAIMPLFGVGILAILLDLGLRRQRAEYLYCIALCLFALLWLRHDYLFDGLADVPVAFMTLAAFYLVELRDDRRIFDWKQLAIPMVIASAAAVTKLNGAYAVGMVGALALLGHFSRRSDLRAADWLKSVGVAIGALVLIPGGWYASKVAETLDTGRVANGAMLVADTQTAAGTASLAGRMLHAVALFPGAWVGVGILAVAVVISWWVPRTRWVSLLILVPYTVLWAAFLSVSLRNWALMVPIAAYVLVFSFGLIAERLWGCNLALVPDTGVDWSISWRVVAGTALAAAVAIAGASAVVPGSRLVAGQVYRQRSIGNPALNQAVYDTVTQHPEITGRLVTDYWYLSVLPGFRDEPYREARTSKIEVVSPSYVELTPKGLDGANYLLLSNVSSPAVQSAIEARIADGTYKVLMTYESEPFMPFFEGRRVVMRLMKVDSR